MPESNKGCRVFWTYTNRFTETNAGGGTNTVKITPAANTALRLIAFNLTMCDAAAGRTAQVISYDEDNNVQFVWNAAGTSLDNQALNFPCAAGAAAANNVPNLQDLITVGDGSYIAAIAASIALNEFFDLHLVFELFGTTTAPVIAHTSTGTASTGTASQNEVTVVPVFA